jgi:glucosyl-3-phosphoglycerate phosphatase
MDSLWLRPIVPQESAISGLSAWQPIQKEVRPTGDDASGGFCCLGQRQEHDVVGLADSAALSELRSSQQKLLPRLAKRVQPNELSSGCCSPSMPIQAQDPRCTGEGAVHAGDAVVVAQVGDGPGAAAGQVKVGDGPFVEDGMLRRARHCPILVLLNEHQQQTGLNCWCGAHLMVNVEDKARVRNHLLMRNPLVIHVVRHGRTRSNRVGLVMGWADESIEPDQHDAVDAVAARLAAAPTPVRVVSSPLARARDTAAPLAAALSVDLETDARLGELYQGPWQGLAESEVARRWPLEWSVWRTAPETLDLDGRETLTALYARVAAAFDDLARSSDAATVVVFTHDAVVRAAVAWTLRVGPATYRHIDVANCSITTICASTSGPRLVALNDTSHLPSSER